jgi:hypothetical protein
VADLRPPPIPDRRAAGTAVRARKLHVRLPQRPRGRLHPRAPRRPASVDGQAHEGSDTIGLARVLRERGTRGSGRAPSSSVRE